MASLLPLDSSFQPAVVGLTCVTVALQSLVSLASRIFLYFRWEERE